MFMQMKRRKSTVDLEPVTIELELTEHGRKWAEKLFAEQAKERERQAMEMRSRMFREGQSE